ncbi:hypothetical protein, partial [Ruminococcus callidus]|uniref:hypothetical protein n=1 Tax=Ruminococcus callidus TaxID=40519 RepID=UPI0039A0532E
QADGVQSRQTLFVRYCLIFPKKAGSGQTRLQNPACFFESVAKAWIPSKNCQVFQNSKVFLV